MTKEELVHITLRQLSESLKTSPDNFRLEDSSVAPTTHSFPGPTIIWQYRVQVEDNKFMVDPLNSVRTIIVVMNKVAKQLTCHIYNREVNNINQAMMPEAQVTIQFSDFLPLCFNRTYRQFMGIRGSILKRRYEKEYLDYMRRLNNIFPATHEEDLFK